MIGATAGGTPSASWISARVGWASGPPWNRELNGRGDAVGRHRRDAVRPRERARDHQGAVKAKLLQAEKGLPPGVVIVTVYDRSDLSSAPLRLCGASWSRRAHSCLVCIVSPAR